MTANMTPIPCRTVERRPVITVIAMKLMMNRRFLSPSAWLLCGMMLILSADANARCSRMWDTAQVVRGGASPLAAIPLDWFQGIDIVRRKIDRQSGINTKLFLCESSTPNAFAWTQWGERRTAVTTGLWKMLRGNKLRNDWHGYAAIIGHENAHHVLKHRSVREGRDAMLSALSVLTSVPAVGTQAINATFSQEEELDADKHGLRYALCAGFSPDGVIRMHERLHSAGGILHSHPPSKLRIKTLQTAARANENAPKCR